MLSSKFQPLSRPCSHAGDVITETEPCSSSSKPAACAWVNCRRQMKPCPHWWAGYKPTAVTTLSHALPSLLAGCGSD